MSGASETGNLWTRRRAAVRAEAEADLKAEADAVVAQERASLEEMSDEDALAELDLPDPDNMEAGSDFSAFMKGAVPDRLRRRALRKLWLTNPVLANVDNLVDYGEDFSISTALVENIQTIYRVGKGMLPDEPDQDLVEDEGLSSVESADLADGDVSAEVIDAPSADEGNEGVSIIEDAGSTMPLEQLVVGADKDCADQVEAEQFVKRRMRFEFAS